MKPELDRLEKETFETDDSPQIPPLDIFAYNELRSCADLYRMKTSGILKIDPGFQREVVWKKPDQTRFIDSLIKQMPIPSMCFSLDYRSQKWQVIDGLQRMSTICKFLSGDNWCLSSLDDVNKDISGKSVPTFHDKKSKLHEYLVRIQNLTLPITILRCDHQKKDHTHYLFTIFHRLNTGGMKLNNQEIRNCIYSGDLNELLKRLNEFPDWMKLNRMKKTSGYRFTKQELILRLFAFHDNYSSYGGRLARFLNDYMADNRDPSTYKIEKKTRMFERTASLVYQRVFNGVVPPKLSTSMLEAILVGVSLNLDYLESKPDSRVHSFYEKLRNHNEFSEERLKEGLSGKSRVVGRMKAARQVFSGQ